MVTKIFLKLTDYAAFRRIIWKLIYELLSKKFKVKDWSFMNYGYSPLAGESKTALEPPDEINRYPIQLYHFLLSKTNIDGAEILEVGSGRGGGCDYLNRYFRPKKVIGLDIAKSAVELANKHYRNETIEFVQGSAEKLPFADGQFDVVINVESSHTYGSVRKFLSEVRRVLRAGGYLLLADIRTSEGIQLLEQQVRNCGMNLILEEEISKNVALAIELEEPIKQERIKKHVAPFLRPLFNQFAGVAGSKAHTQLMSGELIYKGFVLRK